jgi:DNA-binding protein HU-beta
MNKNELIAAAAESTGMTKKDTERVVNAALDAICAQLAAGNRVQLTGFGIFEVKDRQARVGRNPRTKEAVQIPASKTPVFKPSKALKEIVEG